MRRVFSGPLITSAILLAGILLILAWVRQCIAPQRQAQEIWHEHEQVISDIAMEKRVDLDAYEDAVVFFEKLTKINVPSNRSPFIDAMPTKDTATALEPLRRWYAENKGRLYWDEESGEVRLAPY